MNIVLDTNVFVSGIFWRGSPHDILVAWKKGVIQFVLSPDIISEYVRVCFELSKQFPLVDVNPILDLALVRSIVTSPAIFPEKVCDDPDDDKFLACALASNTTGNYLG